VGHLFHAELKRWLLWVPLRACGINTYPSHSVGY
jgi:hypothetical protein